MRHLFSAGAVGLILNLVSAGGAAASAGRQLYYFGYGDASPNGPRGLWSVPVNGGTPALVLPVSEEYHVGFGGGDVAADYAGNLYFTSPGNALMKRDAATGDVTMLADVAAYPPAYLDVDLAGNVFFYGRAVDAWYCPTGIWKVPAGGGEPSLLVEESAATNYRGDRFVVNPAGDLFFASRSDTLLKRDATSGAISTFATAAVIPGAYMAMDALGMLYFFGRGDQHYATQNGIWRLGPDGGRATFVEPFGGTAAYGGEGFVADAEGNLFYSSILRRDVRTGQASVVADAWALSPGGFALVPQLAGDANGDGAVDRLDVDIVLSNLGRFVTGWENGDFNADWWVNGDDLALLHRQLAIQASNSVATPEPGVIWTGCGVLSGRLLLRRRINRA